MISRIAMRLRLLAAFGLLLSSTLACEAPVPEAFSFRPTKPKDTKVEERPDGRNDGGGVPMPDEDDSPSSTPSSPSPSNDGGASDAGPKPPETPASCVDPDLIACFPFDGDTDDHSSSRLTTTANGVTFVAGHLGTAAQLSSGASVVIGGTNALDVTAVTVEAWVQWIDTDTDVTVFSATGRYAMMIESSGNVRCTTPGDSVDGGDVKSGQWVHIACVFDGNEARVFVGGKKEDDGGADGATSPGAGGAIGGNYVGVVDEVRVFRGAKSDAEIAALATR